MLVNDWSLRNLVPAELAKGFGFFQSKPATAFSPVAVTPDELGEAWRDSKVHLPIECFWNGRQVGKAEAGEDMVFNFSQLIAHVARDPQGARRVHHRLGDRIQQGRQPWLLVHCGSARTGNDCRRQDQHVRS